MTKNPDPADRRAAIAEFRGSLDVLLAKTTQARKHQEATGIAFHAGRAIDDHVRKALELTRRLKASNPAETLEITWRIGHELAQLSEALLVLNPEAVCQPMTLHRAGPPRKAPESPCKRTPGSDVLT